MPATPMARRMKARFRPGISADGGKAQLPGGPDGRNVVREQAVQPVRDAREQDAVGPLPALVLLQHGWAADIEAEAERIDDAFDECGDAANAEVETLPGNRVDAAGRIARERQPLGEKALGQDKADRPAPARADEPDFAEEIAEAPFELLHEPGVVERQQRVRKPAPLGPDDGGAVFALRAVGHRQDRERPAREEPLMRHIAVRLLMADRQHQRLLPVGPFHRADPGFAAQRRAAPVGGDDQRRFQHVPAGEEKPGEAPCRARSSRPRPG